MTIVIPVFSRINNEFAKPFIKTHYTNLFERRYKENAWYSTIDKIRPRGFPYKDADRMVSSEFMLLSHGLWANVPDIDGKTQLGLKDFPRIEDYFKESMIGRDIYFPMCGMNVAFKKDLTRQCISC